MNKIKLTKNDIYQGNLILVNSKNLLKEQDEVKDLEPFNYEFPNILLNKEANEHLQDALKEIEAYSKIVPVSGYRSLKEQQDLFNTSLKENGREFTYSYVALPNASEHQTGLAIDLGLNQDNIDFIRPSFPYEGICQEFREIAPKYGFVERYLKVKQNITLIDAEEWHFRYVGYPHSEIMVANDFCLEEYIAFLKKGPFNYKDYEITYLPYKKDNIEVEIDETTRISGNNQDGFIITKKVK